MELMFANIVVELSRRRLFPCYEFLCNIICIIVHCFVVSMNTHDSSLAWHCRGG